MNGKESGIIIKEKAAELGFDGCGIVKIEELSDYKKIIDEKYGNKEEFKIFYAALGKLADPVKNYPWAKSIIVCVNDYSKYKIPDKIDNHIAKYYLFDYKQTPESEVFQRITKFETFLKERNITFYKDPVLGSAPMRYIAEKANLGIIRNNNFFYSKNGSWVFLESWLTDLDTECKEETTNFLKCPQDCNKCIDACPTKALSAPNEFDHRLCITRMTYGSITITPENQRHKVGEKIYGCDECQNACPMNKDFYANQTEFPGINELKELLNPYQILKMSLSEISSILGKKFWFISKERPWVWKCNSIIALANKNEGIETIKQFVNDENNEIRDTALWAMKKTAN